MVYKPVFYSFIFEIITCKFLFKIIHINRYKLNQESIITHRWVVHLPTTRVPGMFVLLDRRVGSWARVAPSPFCPPPLEPPLDSNHSSKRRHVASSPWPTRNSRRYCALWHTTASVAWDPQTVLLRNKNQFIKGGNQ